MSERDAELNRIHTRKQQLVSRAALQRDQLCRDIHTIAEGVAGIGRKARSFSFISSLAASGLAAVGFFRGRFRPPAEQERPSKFKRLVTGAKVAAALWRLFKRPRPS